VKTLILSDIHLGSPVCRHHKVLEVLKREEWGEIIVNGDLLDSGRFQRYSKHHWQVLGALRKLSKKIPVHFVRGNHDRNAEILINILGLDYLEEYVLEFEDGRRGLIIHGDQFDSFIRKSPLLSELAGHFYYFIQRVPILQKLCPVLKEKSKSWLQVSQRVAGRAVAHARALEYSFVCLGHTHKEARERMDGIYYFNSGCFCDETCHYLEVDKGVGKVILREVV
jgi:UDP-2,3-diacylglucosamine pyrophosphatase LpxH